MDEFVKSLHTLRAKKQKQINDTYIWYGIVLDGLGKLAKAKEFKDGRYSIPTLSERGKTVPLVKRSTWCG